MEDYSPSIEFYNKANYFLNNCKDSQVALMYLRKGLEALVINLLDKYSLEYDENDYLSVKIDKLIGVKFTDNHFFIKQAIEVKKNGNFGVHYYKKEIYYDALYARAKSAFENIFRILEIDYKKHESKLKDLPNNTNLKMMDEDIFTLSKNLLVRIGKDVRLNSINDYWVDISKKEYNTKNVNRIQSNVKLNSEVLSSFNNFGIAITLFPINGKVRNTVIDEIKESVPELKKWCLIDTAENKGAKPKITFLKPEYFDFEKYEFKNEEAYLKSYIKTLREVLNEV